MARLSPQDAAQKWASRTQAASQDYAKGVQQVNQSPGAAAAAQAQVAVQNYTQSLTSGAWKSKMQNLSLSDWQQATLTKGVPRYGQGAAAAQSKMTQFMANFLPQLDTVTQKTRSMPKGTLADSIARATAQIQGVANLKGKV